MTLARRGGAARRALLAYAFWWPALHLLLLCGVVLGGVFVALSPPWSSSGAAPGAVPLAALRAYAPLAVLGVLAAAWARRARRAPDARTRRRWAALCLLPAVAYAVLYIHARAVLGWAAPPPGEGGLATALLFAGHLLVLASGLLGAPLAALGLDPLLAALLYPVAVLAGALVPPGSPAVPTRATA